MRNEKRRYLAVKAEDTKQTDTRDLMSAIWDSIYRLFGEVGASKTSLSRIRSDDDEILILRCSHKALSMVRAAIAATTEIHGQTVTIRVLAVSGTLNALRKKLTHTTEKSNPGQPRNLEKLLRNWLREAKKTVVVGVGNDLRMDDSIGISVVRSLKNSAFSNVMLIESETVPESFIESIVEFSPTHVLVIDAGLVGLHPGQAKFLKSVKRLGPLTTAVSSHALPLRLFCEYLEKAANAKVGLVIVQPETTDFGEGMSKRVKCTAEKLRTSLERIFTKS
ncbi:MAG: hydrogenase maturation protease [Candidatus Bathyarchaeota archaeon]|nr:MAG: hydrogenase maturation protease [Candidatus Bathyarchaeota archaeon]